MTTPSPGPRPFDWSELGANDQPGLGAAGRPQDSVFYHRSPAYGLAQSRAVIVTALNQA